MILLGIKPYNTVVPCFQSLDSSSLRPRGLAAPRARRGAARPAGHPPPAGTPRRRGHTCDIAVGDTAYMRVPLHILGIIMCSSWHWVFAVKVSSVEIEGTASAVVRERYEELSYPTQDDVKAMWAYITDGPGWLNTFSTAAWGGVER